MAATLLTSLARATITGLFGGTGTAADTITIGGQVYALATTPTTVANEVKVGASAAATCTNLVNAINAGTGSGSLYGSLTVANAYVTAVDDLAAGITIKSRVSGAIGNAIVISESGTGFAWTGAATRLASGAAQVQDLLNTELTRAETVFQLNAAAHTWINALQADLAL